MRILLGIILALGSAVPYGSFGMDVIKIERPLSDADNRAFYKNAVLRAALDASSAEFGPYRIEEAPRVLSSPERAKMELAEGTFINTYITSATVGWEAAAIPIRFPIRKGINGFKLILTHKDNVEKFRNVRSKEDLKQLTCGTIDIGSFAKTLISHDFDIVNSPTFDSAFYMLAAKRFDFMARGVNEIFGEVDSGLSAFNDIVIVPDIALHIPIASYLFVSPKHPRIADRFTHGFRVIANNGEFERIFEHFQGENLKKAALDKRRIIFMENPHLPKAVTFDYRKHWYEKEKPTLTN